MPLFRCRSRLQPAALLLSSLAACPCAATQVPEETLAEGSRAWDAAIGLIVNHGPSYPGSVRQATSVAPGAAVRWGRFSFSSRSAISARGADAGSGSGLRVELANGERLRAGLGLRLDGGRRESDSLELRGMGDVRGTLRLRLSVSYRLDDGWRLRAATLLDALGRGGGLQGDLQISRDRQLTPTLSMNGALSLGWANGRHLQTYFGVTPEQASRSGYAENSPTTSLRDITLSAGVRHALGQDWAVFGSASASRLLGQAAASPLTRQRKGWGLGMGLVYRF